MERQLSGNGRIPIDRPETDADDNFVDVVLADMQFDPYRPLTRFAVGEGGAFFTNDGVNWNRLLDTGALPGRPVNCYYDWISNPCERSLYVAFAGRSLVKISPLPWGALQAPDPALWSPSVMVSGRQTKSTPAVAIFQGVMHIVRNDGQNDALVWATSADALNWNPDQPLGQQSQTGASIAAFGTLLHMVHLDSGSNNIRWSTFDGGAWTDNGQIANVSSQTLPALVPFGGKLFMVFTDPASSQIRLLTFHIMVDGSYNWDPNSLQNIKGQLSTRPVKLAVFEQRIHMVYLQDSSNHICWSVSDGNVWWPRTRIRCRKGQSAPALAVHNGLLHMVHQGDGSNSTWWSLYDGDEWTPSVTIPDQDSPATVALCETPVQSQLTMLRLDLSDNLWFSAV